MISLLVSLGYVESQKGRTSGSRVRFQNKEKQSIIDLHRPHPSNVIKSGVMKDVLEKLINARIISL
nr:type II toxin-antitoxin system HicA family toxin [uncultured Proteiniphilum sp.]